MTPLRIALALVLSSTGCARSDPPALTLPAPVTVVMPPPAAPMPVAVAAVPGSPAAPAPFAVPVARPATGALPAERVELRPGGPLGEQLTAHAQGARARGMLPVAYMHAAWCRPCAAVEQYAQDPRMQQAFAGVSVAGVEIDAFTSAEMNAAGVGVDGIPTWLVLGADGRPTGRTISSDRWGPDIPENMAPVLGPFFAETPR